MIGQTLAMFTDAYRELNARWLFWITLIISAAFVGGFAIVGADSHGLTLLTHRMEMKDAIIWYHYLFSLIVIGFWLTWASIVLALVSTAGIFPEFVGGGSIDLYLAKPLGRARLFITKYLTGLLFVTLQVAIVIGGSFVVVGLRAHEWRPSLFWAIPIIVCFFSYLFSICVLLGVATRSTIAALLVTILCWAMLALLDRAEPQVLTGQKIYEIQTRQQEREADDAEANLRRASANPKSLALVPTLRQQAESARRRADQTAKTTRMFQTIHTVIYDVKLATPKTTDTAGLLDRYLFTNAREAEVAAGVNPDRAGEGNDPMSATMTGLKETVEDVRARSPVWIIGTSLAFEAVLVFWAGWIFCRRDY